MGRLSIVVVLLVALAGAMAGCSTSASTSRPTAKQTLPVCNGENPANLAKASSGGTLIIANKPCSLPPPITGPLPMAVPVGTTVALSYPGPNGESGHFTINRIWTNATPQYDSTEIAPAGTTLSSVVSGLLQGAHLPPRQPLMWVGVDLTMTNTGNNGIWLGGASGPGPKALYFLVNGAGAGIPEAYPYTASLSSSGFEMGVHGCPFPFGSEGILNPGETFSGCVALAVTAGTKVSQVGFNFAPIANPVAQQVAQWRV